MARLHRRLPERRRHFQAGGVVAQALQEGASDLGLLRPRACQQRLPYLLHLSLEFVQLGGRPTHRAPGGLDGLSAAAAKETQIRLFLRLHTLYPYKHAMARYILINDHTHTCRVP